MRTAFELGRRTVAPLLAAATAERSVVRVGSKLLKVLSEPSGVLALDAPFGADNESQGADDP